MAFKQPMQGPGQFQWNKGGWFGGQIGGTAWLLPTGLIFLYRTPLVGIIWIAIYTAINTLGFWIWNRRDRIEPYRAIQLLLAACGVGGLVAVGALDLIDPNAALPSLVLRGSRLVLEDEGRISLRQAYLFFLIGVPAMMGWFSVMEHGARKVRAVHDSGQVTTSQPRTNQ